jgi:hypothetical protein
VLATDDPREAGARELAARPGDESRFARAEEPLQALDRDRGGGGSDSPANARGGRRSLGPPPDPAAEAARLAKEEHDIEAFVLSQGRDAQWAPAYESKLSSLARQAKSVVVKDDRCFTSACRLELAYASEQSRGAFLQELQSHLYANAEASAIAYQPSVGDDGKPHMVFHVFRPGYPLPPSLM